MADKDLMTYQLNPLINAQKGFNVMETRLFYLGLKDINPHVTENDIYFDAEFPDTYISPMELKNIFGNGKYLPEIKKACKNLIGVSIEINYKDGFDLYTVFQHIKYKEKKGLHIKFNEDMRDFILDIYKGYKKYGFTKIEMQQIFMLDSTYAMRLLEILLQYSGEKKKGIIHRTLNLDELRNRLNVPENSYKTMSNFRSRALDLPIKEIERKTPYRIKYEPIKKGRKVVAFEFQCDCNSLKNDDEYTETIESTQAPEIKDSPSLPESNNGNEKNYIKLVHYGFSQKAVQALLEVCGGVDELARRLEYGEKRAKQDTEKGKKIDNISGYLRRAIEENWLKTKQDEEKAKERELEAVKTNEKWELWAKENFSNEPVPEVPETPFDKDDDMAKVLINMIKKEIKNKSLGKTSQRLLTENGLTVSRFIELYM